MVNNNCKLNSSNWKVTILASLSSRAHNVMDYEEVLAFVKYSDNYDAILNSFFP